MDLEGFVHSAACVTGPPRIAVRPAGANPRSRYDVPPLSLRLTLTRTLPTVCDSKPEPFIKFWRDLPGTIVRVFCFFLLSFILSSM